MTSAKTLSSASVDLMIESPSCFDFNTTLDSLSDIILDNGWRITMIHDLQETMKKNGKEVLPVKVIEVCNPDLAFQILSKDEVRDFSPMLPCRISVYEKTDSKTYVARMNIPVFGGMVENEAAGTMQEAFTKVEEFVKAVVM
jgi:uncharacterized protein (DUF302 family)